MAAARGHADRACDRVERGDDAGDRFELGVERVPVQMPEGLLPIRVETPAELSLDLPDHVLLRAADEALDHLGLGQRPAELGEHPDVDPHADPLAVDEHPVAVEDDEIPGHA
jgi:hypothetical protein